MAPRGCGGCGVSEASSIPHAGPPGLLGHRQVALALGAVVDCFLGLDCGPVFISRERMLSALQSPRFLVFWTRSDRGARVHYPVIREGTMCGGIVRVLIQDYDSRPSQSMEVEVREEQ